jgi:class 3 adenylate cyclase
MTASRRLAAILAADVAGYSRLMAADEEGTLERLKALRRELVDPKIAEHKGRIVKTTGDGLLVEFASVVDAVRCAVAVQQAMPERNTGVAADNRIEQRIGINLGDVIVEGDDLYGDGVNIAARIEALADAGAICISRTILTRTRHDQPSPASRLATCSPGLRPHHLRARPNGGRACIRGLRITVGLIVSLVADSVPRDEILADYTDLEGEDIRQALSYAAWLAREEVAPA